MEEDLLVFVGVGGVLFNFNSIFFFLFVLGVRVSLRAPLSFQDAIINSFKD